MPAVVTHSGPVPHHTCPRCVHFCRPGLSDGHCGGPRPDLPPAYGENHPLRCLPADGGKSCAHYEARW